MDAERWRRIEALFDSAMTLPEQQRRGWLNEACTEDPSLIEQVIALIEADEAGDPVASPVSRSVEQELRAIRLEPGQRIGAWTIERLLASGGMGAVYLACRSDQAFDQRVVVKIVALPLNEDLHARFRRERQILADLSHPYIARLLDGGTMAGGEPYLVMEYIKGCDIATWCDRERLGLSDRLSLICRVGEAVQFAHANLVVHRDIKPANVYVDQAGTPRLLDFGIASLLEADSNVQGPHWAAADTRLTGAYASPEQRNGQAVTTASDVYSLGALLYRLLTGRPPRMDSPAEPEPPSAVLSDLVKADTGGLVAADLDAVVARSLAQDPGQRYVTAQAMIDDLSRLQALRPTRARPVGRLGRLGRAVRRNQLLSGTIAGSGLLLLVFVVSIAVLTIHLDRERNFALMSAATTEQVSNFVFELFDGADPEINQGELPSALDLLDRGTARIQEDLLGQDRVRARLLHRMGRAYQGLGQFEQAHELLVAALASLENPEPDDKALYWSVMVDLADIERELGLRSAARDRLDQVIDNLAGNASLGWQLASAYNNRGLIAATQEEFTYAESMAHQALSVALPDGSEREILHTRFRHNLAQTLGRQRRHEEAIELLESVIADKQRLLGDPHPSTLRSLEVLASNHRLRGDYETAAAVFTRILQGVRDIYGDASPAEARVFESLANLYHDRGDYANAERAYRQALTFHDAWPERNPLLHAIVVNNLASLFEDRGNLVDAETLFRRSLAMRRDLAGDNEITVIHARGSLARVLIKQGAFDEAEDLLGQVDQALASYFPDNQLRRVQLDWQMALLTAATGDPGHGLDQMQAILERLNETWPDRPALQARAKLDAAGIELALGANLAAKHRSTAAMDMLQSLHPPDHPDLLRAQVLRAEALAAQGKQDQARAMIASSMPALNERFSPGSAILISAERLSGWQPEHRKHRRPIP